MQNIYSSVDIKQINLFKNKMRFLLDSSSTFECNRINNAIDQFIIDNQNGIHIVFNFDIREKYLNCDISLGKKLLYKTEYDYKYSYINNPKFNTLFDLLLRTRANFSASRRFDSDLYMSICFDLFAVFLPEFLSIVSVSDTKSEIGQSEA